MRRALTVLLVLTALAGLAACGDDDDSGDAGTTTTTADPTAAITETYEFFFNGSSPDNAAKLALLENPDEMESVFNAALADPTIAPLLGSTQGRVETVTVTGPDTADVTFNILTDRQPATPGAFNGRAVLVEGTWRVADATFCNLIGLANPVYNDDPACALE